MTTIHLLTSALVPIETRVPLQHNMLSCFRTSNKTTSINNFMSPQQQLVEELISCNRNVIECVHSAERFVDPIGT